MNLPLPRSFPEPSSRGWRVARAGTAADRREALAARGRRGVAAARDRAELRRAVAAAARSGGARWRASAWFPKRNGPRIWSTLLALDRALPDDADARGLLLAAVRRADRARGRKRRAQRARRTALRGERRRLAAPAARASRCASCSRSRRRRSTRSAIEGVGRQRWVIDQQPDRPPRSDATRCRLVRRDDPAARGPARDHAATSARTPAPSASR